jgi:hypothetical protein
MINRFKQYTSSIVSFFEKCQIPDEEASILMECNIQYITSLVEYRELSEVVLKFPCKKFVKLSGALQKYDSPNQILIHIDLICIYVLLEDVDSFITFIKKLASLVIKPNLHQIIGHNFPQKLTVHIVDGTMVKTIKTTFEERVTIEQTNSFMWEVTLDDKLYSNYAESKEMFNKFADNIKLTGTTIPNPPLTKGIFTYVRFNINSTLASPTPAMVLKHMICELIPEQLAISNIEEKSKTSTKRNETMLKNNSNVISWINLNPPSESEQKLDYYDRYEATSFEKAISKSVFTTCMKSLGYGEKKIKGRVYWKIESL